LYLTLGLVAFGLIMILSASAYLAESANDQYQFLFGQLRSFGLGLIVLAVFSRIDYHIWRRFSGPILLSLVVMLLLVFVSPTCRSVHRCIELGPFQFQPAEFVKVGFLIYLAAWLSGLGSQLEGLKTGFLAFCAVLGLISGLIFLEPDMGTAVTLMLAGTLVYFFAGAPWQHLALGVLLGILLLGMMTISAEYRLERLQTFLSGEASDNLGSGYHTSQIGIALGSGGLWGLGLGQGKLKELGYLPEVHTDSIFTVVVEELGFVRALLVILAYLLLLMRGFRIAKSAPDRFGQLLTAGLVSLIAIQVSINLAAILTLVPLTGIPLPLMSYGGSSLIATLGSIGIILSISRQIQPKAA
jgi:cell division protein FtsW